MTRSTREKIKRGGTRSFFYIAGLVLLFYFTFTLLPIAIFPCEVTGIDGIKKPDLCSIGMIDNNSQPFVDVEITVAGDILRWVAIYLVPVSLGLFLGFRRDEQVK